jgi:hypothetical protein
MHVDRQNMTVGRENMDVDEAKKWVFAMFLGFGQKNQGLWGGD